MEKTIFDEFKSSTSLKRQLKDLGKKLFPKRYIAKIRHKNVYGENLSFVAPKDLNEKITWLKFHYVDDPLVIRAGDKIGIREYLTQCGLEEYCPPMILSFLKAKDIPWEKLPEQFVIKKSNASGQNLIIKNKEQSKKSEVIKILKTWEKTPYSYECGEPHYDKMLGGFIVEPYHQDFDQDWKFLCLNGEFALLQVNVWSGKANVGHRDQTVYFLNEEGRIRSITNPGHSENYHVGEKFPLVKEFSLMKEVTEKIAQDFPLVRVDYFFAGGKLYIGELTFTPYGGLSAFSSELSKELGEKLTLPLEVMPNAFRRGKIVKAKRCHKTKLTLRRFLSDKSLTQLKYMQYFHKPLNLKSVHTLAEKINWLKLYYAQIEKVAYAGDKITMRDYVKEKNLECLLTKKVNTFRHSSELVEIWHDLPRSFVIKKSNASGQNIVVKNKAQLGLGVTLNELKKWEKNDFSKINGEAHYKNMLGEFIVEEYIPHIVNDVKLLYLNGKFAFYQISYWGKYYTVSEREELVVTINDNHVIEHIDDEGWTSRQPFVVGTKIASPKDFSQMKVFGRKLAEDFPLVRVDFLLGEDFLRLGELTFTPCAGLEIFDKKIQKKYGQMLDLPQQ